MSNCKSGGASYSDVSVGVVCAAGKTAAVAEEDADSDFDFEEDEPIVRGGWKVCQLRLSTVWACVYLGRGRGGER